MSKDTKEKTVNLALSKGQKLRRRKENIIGYSFISMSCVGFILFMAFPLCYSLFISFMDWSMFKGLEGSTFIGIANYIDALHNDYFITGFWNNMILMVLVVPALMLISLVIATLLNGKVFARGLLRASYFMPYIAVTTASALVFSGIFNPDFGPINEGLRALGIANPPGWVVSSFWAIPTVGIFLIWKSVGYCIVIYLASLQGISGSYYEAASIDGASKIEQFIHITVPLISPTTFFLLITNVIYAFRTFEEVQILTEGGPGSSSYTMIFSIYQKGFAEFDMGAASAQAWIYFVLVLIVTAFQFWGQKKWVNY